MRALLIDEACVVTPSAAPNPICGTLYVVATPIGNLDDISARALTILRSVALIAAEDTRHSARLMQHFGIATPLAACHEHNERDQGGRFLARLQAGEVFQHPMQLDTLLVEPERTAALSVDAPLLYSRPAIDFLFESAADAYGSSLAAVLLTGATRAMEARRFTRSCELPTSAVPRPGGCATARRSTKFSRRRRERS